MEKITFTYETEGLTVTKTFSDEFMRLADIAEHLEGFLNTVGWDYAYVRMEGTTVVIDTTKDVVEAEKALYNPSSYWDEAVAEVEREFENKSADIGVGSIVGISLTESIHDIEGYSGISLLNKRGVVIEIMSAYSLVKWIGWNDGHGGGYADGEKSYWWVDTKNLKVLI
jgi:hypothetical protein